MSFRNDCQRAVERIFRGARALAWIYLIGRVSIARPIFASALRYEGPDSIRLLGIGLHYTLGGLTYGKLKSNNISELRTHSIDPSIDIRWDVGITRIGAG